jgi:uncharacterized protein with PIN domain
MIKYKDHTIERIFNIDLINHMEFICIDCKSIFWKNFKYEEFFRPNSRNEIKNNNLTCHEIIIKYLLE